MPADELLETPARPARTARAQTGSFLGLARLSADHWLAVAELPGLPAGEVEVRPALTSDRIGGSWLPFAGGASGALLIEGSTSRLNLTRGVALVAGRKRVEVAPLPGLHAVGSVDALVDRHLAALDDAARSNLLAALAPLPVRNPQLSSALRTMRNRLREPLPAATADPASPCPAHADVIWRLDDRAFYVEGWLHERRSVCERLTAISPEGMPVELADTVFRFARSDVADFLGLPATRRRRTAANCRRCGRR